jgi:hypothetical protein
VSPPLKLHRRWPFDHRVVCPTERPGSLDQMSAGPDPANLRLEEFLSRLDPRRVVSFGHFDGTVPEQLRNDLDRDTLQQQRHRKRVAKAMGMPAHDRRLRCREHFVKHAIPALDHALALTRAS